MLTVKKLIEALEGLDPDTQVVVGIVNGPCFNAAYAEQEVRAKAEVDVEQRLTLLDATAPVLYLCCYEQPRPWEGSHIVFNDDGTAILEYDPEEDDPEKED